MNDFVWLSDGVSELPGKGEDFLPDGRLDGNSFGEILLAGLQDALAGIADAGATGFWQLKIGDDFRGDFRGGAIRRES